MPSLKFIYGHLKECQESIKNPSKPNNGFGPKGIDGYWLSKVKFNGNCLKQDSFSFIQENVVSLYIFRELNTWSRDLNTDFTLANFLFGLVKLTLNDDSDKYGYSGYGIEFGARLQILWSEGSCGKNVIIFRVDAISSVYVDNKKKDIFLVLGEGPTQGLDDTAITVNAKYPIKFLVLGKRFVLSLYYNERNSFLFVNSVQMYQFKIKGSEIKPYPLCLGNILKDFTINNMKKTKQNKKKTKKKQGLKEV